MGTMGGLLEGWLECIPNQPLENKTTGACFSLHADTMDLTRWESSPPEQPSPYSACTPFEQKRNR